MGHKSQSIVIYDQNGQLDRVNWEFNASLQKTQSYIYIFGYNGTCRPNQIYADRKKMKIEMFVSYLL